MTRKKTILVDVDGTLAHYDGWKGIHHIGDPFPHAKEFLFQLREKFEVAIWTTRCNLDLNQKEVPADVHDPQQYLIDKVKGWLDEHGMEYDTILPGKPICAGFIDDRAISCRPMESLGDGLTDEQVDTSIEQEFLSAYAHAEYIAK